MLRRVVAGSDREIPDLDSSPNIINPELSISDVTYEAASVSDSSSAAIAAYDQVVVGKTVAAGVVLSDANYSAIGLTNMGGPPGIRGLPRRSGINIFMTDAATGGSLRALGFVVNGVSSIINFSGGEPYEFPCIENTQLSPAQFNKDVVYNNNISSKGHFLGRTAVRRGATVTLEPLSFIATTDRMNEILELFEKLETRACYVHYKVADKDFVHYGWTESEPSYQYTADEEYVQVSFTLRCPA